MLKTLKTKVQSAPERQTPRTITVTRQRGRPWMRKRESILQRDFGICQECKRIGRLSIAHPVDHIVPLHLGGSDDDSNLESLCIKCHEAKNKREHAQRFGKG
jgi:5-methylcytosine-specific restriction protein A